MRGGSFAENKMSYNDDTFTGCKGVEMMNEGEVISVDDIKSASSAQGITIERGDVVIFHTGWLSLLGKENQRYAAGEPGIDAKSAEYLAGLEVVAVGMDN